MKTAKQTAHTPTPLMRTEPTKTPWFYRKQMGKDTRGQIIAFDDFICAVPIHENAKHIVHCVNNHAKLVEALEECKSYLERIACDIPLENQDSNEVAEIILEALKQAKGEL